AWEHRVRHRGLSEISEGALGPLQPRRYMRIKGKFLGGATPRPAWRLLENASKGRPECGPRPRGAAPPGERTAYAARSLGFPAVREFVFGFIAAATGTRMSRTPSCRWASSFSRSRPAGRSSTRSNLP